MDPLTRLLEHIRATFGDVLPKDALTALENTATSLFERFELVPKHEYEAHMAVLESLQAQVASLEQRLETLERT